MRALSIAILIALTISCTHSLHISQFSDFGPTYAAYQKGEWVKSEASQFAILGWVGQTDFVNEAYAKLMDQCQGGQIQSIEAQYTTDHGFLSWTNRVNMQGLCLKKN